MTFRTRRGAQAWIDQQETPMLVEWKIIDRGFWWWTRKPTDQ
jgi:hypothetical protein